MQCVQKLPVQMNSTAAVTAGNQGKSQFIPHWVPVCSHCWDTWNCHAQVLAGAGRRIQAKRRGLLGGCVSVSSTSPPSAPAAGARP